jgi:hypothetical protein
VHAMRSTFQKRFRRFFITNKVLQVVWISKPIYLDLVSILCPWHLNEGINPILMFEDGCSKLLSVFSDSNIKKVALPPSHIDFTYYLRKALKISEIFSNELNRSTT